MKICILDKNKELPNPINADKKGLLAIGGELDTDRLKEAYSKGIFPWFSEDEPILWWSPDPRFVLIPEEIKVSRSMKKFLNKDIYRVTFDEKFYEVISMCAKMREGNTWITQEMIEAYYQLHKEGYAHSVEVWYGDILAGGLYGVSFGRAFFGESMFSLFENSSKTGFIYLTQKLKEKGFDFIDCQVYTKYLESFGAKMVERTVFLSILKESLKKETLKGKWNVNIF